MTVWHCSCGCCSPTPVTREYCRKYPVHLLSKSTQVSQVWHIDDTYWCNVWGESELTSERISHSQAASIRRCLNVTVCNTSPTLCCITQEAKKNTRKGWGWKREVKSRILTEIPFMQTDTNFRKSKGLNWKHRLITTLTCSIYLRSIGKYTCHSLTEWIL